MVADLAESSLAGYPLEGLLFGGSPTPDSLVGRAQQAFPKANMYAPLPSIFHSIFFLPHEFQDAGIWPYRDKFNSCFGMPCARPS